MRNKTIAGAMAAMVLLSAAALFWYFTPSDVSIAGTEVWPEQLLIGQLGELKVFIQNNASKDVNVTIDVKNAFVDEKGVSLKGFTLLAYGNLSNLSGYISGDAIDKPRKEILLKPGSNIIIVSIGYQVPGTQKVVVDVYRQGKLADSRTVEINVPTPKINLNLWNYTGYNGTDEIHTVYGNLQLLGEGSASGVMVNISLINEFTNTTVSTVTRKYSLYARYGSYDSENLVNWEIRNSISDPVTGMQTNFYTETFAPVVVIELSRGKPSAEKYILSPIVVKGRAGERYKVIATARWMDQVVVSEMEIPAPVSERTPGEAIAEAQARVYFRILKPSYIPEGFSMDTARVSGTKFYGSSSEFDEQAMLVYKKRNEYLFLQELFAFYNDVNASDSRVPGKFVDINGVQGRYLEESGGIKSLYWKKGKLSLWLSNYAYNESGYTNTSLDLDDMIKMAGSVR